MTIEEYAQTLAMVLKAKSVRAGEFLLTDDRGVDGRVLLRGPFEERDAVNPRY